MTLSKLSYKGLTLVQKDGSGVPYTNASENGGDVILNSLTTLADKCENLPTTGIIICSDGTVSPAKLSSAEYDQIAVIVPSASGTTYNPTTAADIVDDINNNAGNGDEVVIPAGSFDCGAIDDLTPTAGVIIRGQGIDTTILYGRLRLLAAGSANTFYWSDMTLDLTGEGAFGFAPCELDDGIFRLLRVKVTNAETTNLFTIISQNAKAYDFMAQDCYFENANADVFASKYGGAGGVNTDSTCVCVGCTFDNCGNAGSDQLVSGHSGLLIDLYNCILTNPSSVAKMAVGNDEVVPSSGKVIDCVCSGGVMGSVVEGCNIDALGASLGLKLNAHTNNNGARAINNIVSDAGINSIAPGAMAATDIVRIEGNLVLNPNDTITITAVAWDNTACILITNNNTFINVYRGVDARLTAGRSYLTNNVHSFTRVEANAYSAIGNSLTVQFDNNTHTIGTSGIPSIVERNSILEEPELDANYVPIINGNCYRNGAPVSLQSRHDFYGVQRPIGSNSTCRGAFELDWRFGDLGLNNMNIITTDVLGSSTSTVVVHRGSTDIESGTNLLAAYALAKTMSPASDNRIVVFIPAGTYDLVTTEFEIDTDFIDIMGVGECRCLEHDVGDPANTIISFPDTVITSATGKGGGTDLTGVIHITTARNAHISKFHLINTDAISSWYPQGIIIENANDFDQGRLIDIGITVSQTGASDRGIQVEGPRNCNAYHENVHTQAGTYMASSIGGIFVDCTAGRYGFGGLTGSEIVSAEFRNCKSGNESFGYAATSFSGSAVNCIGGTRCFGGSGTISGTCTNCTAGIESFGGLGGNCTSTSVFTNCIGGDMSFGGDDALTTGNADGKFIDCVGGDYSFGYLGTANGEFINCTGGDYCFGQSDTNGRFVDCVGGDTSFASAKTAAGTYIDCFSGINSFGYNGTLDGVFIDCEGGDRSFEGANNSSLTARLTRCRSVGRSTTVDNWRGLMEFCTFECTSNNADAVVVTGAARIYDCTLIPDGTGNPIGAGGAQTPIIAHCRSTKALDGDANITNALGNDAAALNIADAAITI